MISDEMMGYHEAPERYYSGQLTLVSQGEDILKKMPILREGIDRKYLSKREVTEAVLKGIELRCERKRRFGQELGHALTALATNHEIDINMYVIEEGKRNGIIGEEDVKYVLTLYELSRGLFLNL